ncbi:MAG: DNA starvation/stationary phase protection protein [Acidobacteria bacterium]|nr:DNA starvation/stationary phase protection protein [Acidobacteriota bacterium]
MAETGTKKTKTNSNNKLNANNKPHDEVVECLQRQVANGFILYLNYKHYHWQTFGPLFRDLHRLFDEFAAEVYETIDELAERVRMIGQNPVSRIEEFLQTASIKSAGKSNDMREMIREADENSRQIIAEMRAGIKIADERDDPGTADVLTRFVQIHEKQEWWLRDILERRDGLTD